MTKFVRHDFAPLTKQQLDALQSVFVTLSSEQLAWISGYLWGLLCNTERNEFKIGKVLQPSTETTDITSINNSLSIPQIVIISASQTGNARKLAQKLKNSLLILSNFNIVLFNAGDFKFQQISTVEWLIIITSTYGDGEPPEEAISLYKYLFSKKARRMEKTYFAVFSLGDRSYTHFAQAGKDLDNRLEELGAVRLHKRVDVDLDFEETADVWIKEIVSLFQEKKLDTDFICTPIDKTVEIISNQQQKIIIYSKEFPFTGVLLERQKITSDRSLKDVHHLEIDINNSNLTYQPGDALGVWYENDMYLVREILELLHLTGSEQVEIRGKLLSLNEALYSHCELTKNTFVVVRNMATITKNKDLLDLLLDSNVEKLNAFIQNTPIVEMVRCVSTQLSPQDLSQSLCPIKPRFYSISSAQGEVGMGEVHITVGVVRYKINGRFRSGGASSYLVDRLKENDNLRVFIMSNNNFRLPKDSNISIVMIGSGTGIAPFRAFMQQRLLDGALGKNWLFFGNLRFVDDFLYQIEWQRYVKDGLLTRINTAWSREQDHKIYVQDKLLENSVELWSWIQDGAYVYVCGNANRMAYGVEQALVQLVSEHGNMDIEGANEFWDNMRMQHRYQRDIY